MRRERGVSFLEYVIVTAGLLLIFLWAGAALRSGATDRFDESAGTVRNMAPCASGASAPTGTKFLSGDECL